MGTHTELSHRSDSRELAAFSGMPQHLPLLHGESGGAAWRLLEVFSASGEPFALELQWSGGAGTGASARVSVSHAARLCLFARTVTVRVANLSSRGNRVGVTVADGFAPTANCWEERAFCDGVTPAVMPIPPFASRVVVDLEDVDHLASTVISIVDGTDRRVSRYAGDRQPAGGLLLGAAKRIEILTPIPLNLRGVFSLSM